LFLRRHTFTKWPTLLKARCLGALCRLSTSFGGPCLHCVWCGCSAPPACHQGQARPHSSCTGPRGLSQHLQARAQGITGNHTKEALPLLSSSVQLLEQPRARRVWGDVPGAHLLPGDVDVAARCQGLGALEACTQSTRSQNLHTRPGQHSHTQARSRFAPDARASNKGVTGGVSGGPLGMAAREVASAFERWCKGSPEAWFACCMTGRCNLDLGQRVASASRSA